MSKCEDPIKASIIKMTPVLLGRKIQSGQIRLDAFDAIMFENIKVTR
jgi:hypothetical protein